MKINQRHIKFAKLVYEDELTDAEIAKECEVSLSHSYIWRKNPEIQKLIDQLGEADVQKAKRKIERTSIKAAKTLESCLTCGEPETCRKAACNVLESTELKQEPGAVTINIVDKKLEVSETKNEH